MNLPLNKNYNSNQSFNQIVGSCGNLSDEKAQWTESIKNDFLINLDYKQITKNAINTVFYDTWIYKSNEQIGQRPINYTESKAFLSYPYDTVQFELGDNFNFDLEDGTNSDWLVTEINKLQLYDVNGKIERCNNTLSFQITDGTVKTYSCVFDLNNGSLQYNGQLITIDSKPTLKIQYNENTVLLAVGQRIILDNRTGVTNPDTYRITDINNKNVYGNKGYTIYYLERNKFDPTADNLTYKVADFKVIVKSVGSCKILYDDKCTIYCGGSFKKFTANFYDSNNNLLDLIPVWSYESSISGAESNFNPIIDTVTKTIKLQCLNNASLIGSKLTLSLKDSLNTYSASIEIEVISF